MIFQFNPFQLNLPFGSQPIKSIQILSNLDWFDIPGAAISGENVVLPINAKSVTALKVFATGTSDGVPSMQSLLPGHIPNIEISQVSGLSSALNSLVKTLASGNDTSLAITNNGVGDYTITPNFGTTANKFAVGNDSRFPSNVTGIRKGAGAGGLDVAATAKVDYWDTSVFGASGGSHDKGLVPDPGSSAGTTKFLREDGSWIVPAGSGTVTSVGLTLPAEFSVAGSPITGSGTFTVTRATQTANTVMAGPVSGSPATPTFRALSANDIGPLVGTGSNTIAAGNDTRFPASVTGLRKGAGAGSLDTAAVARTDYWDGTVFAGFGPASSKGLVPDPGNHTGQPTKYLREDSTWAVFVPAGGSITNNQLANTPSGTIKGNPTGGFSNPLDVDVKTARGSTLLNLESVTTHGNSDYTMLATDRYVATSATLTTPRTWTLPLANTFNPGQPITVSDDFGGISPTNTLSVVRQGADTIQGSSAAVVLDTAFSAITFVSNGSNKWSVSGRRPSVRKLFITGNTTYNTPAGIKALLVEGIGGGGGGAGAQASSSNAAGGSGGGGAGYAQILISSPASSYAITIGAGGAGGIGNLNGADGGQTTFGAVLNVTGGLGGQPMTSGSSVAFGTPGTGSGAVSGDWYAVGSDGGRAIRINGTNACSGAGGAAPVYSGLTRGTAVANDGLAGARFGGGGSGALSLSSSAFNGGPGSQGVILITEYY